VLHPAADLAILHVVSTPGPPDEPFSYIGGLALGIDFYAYGFPEDLQQPPAEGDRARLFVGHIQRVMTYQQAPYRYVAAELSVGVPVGLSGGPVFYTDHPGTGAVFGVATTNVDSATASEAFEEVEEHFEDGRVVRTEYRRVITYGIALLLPNMRDWIDAEIPPPASESGGGN
jgi:hypothetical protein